MALILQYKGAEERNSGEGEMIKETETNGKKVNEMNGYEFKDNKRKRNKRNGEETL